MLKVGLSEQRRKNLTVFHIHANIVLELNQEVATMRLTEICSIVAVSAFSSLVFYGFGMNFLLALAIGVLFCLGGFSLLNYLNYGQFRPFVSRSSVIR